VRLNDITSYIQRGKSPKYSNIPIYPVIAQKCNQWSGFSIDLARFIDPETVHSYQKERLLRDGDLMWNSTGLGTLGRLAIYHENKNPYGWAVADSHVTVIRVLSGFINCHFIYNFLSSPIVQSVIEEKASGSTKQKELLTKTIKEYLIPLPPLAEQQRIIEAIESAIEKVDEYAESYNRLEQLDKEFPDKLKKSILQYAMQGKLVEQDPNDESVEVLLEKIRAEKEKLFEEGKIKKKDLEISIVSQGDDNSYYLNNIKIEIDFPRRSTWLLAPLEKIVTTISAKPYQIKQSEIVKEGKIPVVSQSKILVEGFSNNFSKILDYKTDVVIFGDHTRNLKIIDFPFVVGADGVKILSPICLSAKFLKYHLDYTLLFVRNRGYARHYSYLKSKIIGIPSVLEQKRIVAKIDLLFQKVSQL